MLNRENPNNNANGNRAANGNGAPNNNPLNHAAGRAARNNNLG